MRFLIFTFINYLSNLLSFKCVFCVLLSTSSYLVISFSFSSHLHLTWKKYVKPNEFTTSLKLFFPLPNFKCLINFLSVNTIWSWHGDIKSMFKFTEVIKGDGKEIPDVVKRWVEQYEGNPKSAMAELLTMLFEVICIAFQLNWYSLKDFGTYNDLNVLSLAGMRCKILSWRRVPGWNGCGWCSS